MRFDAYSATIRGASQSDVADAIAQSLGCIVARGRPMRRYSEVLNIDAGPRMAAWIGKAEDSDQIYVEGKGETSPALVECIRANFQHTCPRADVCDDVDEEGAFDRLQSLIRANKGSRVKAGYVALPDDVKDGKTWAVGVRGGVTYLRLYEAGKHPDRLAQNRPNWVRPELEVRPHYARDKAAAANMSPMEMWGMSSWSHKVGQAITGTEFARFEPEVRQYTHNKTLRYLALNFRRVWEEMEADGEDIARTLRQIREDEDEYNRSHAHRR